MRVLAIIALTLLSIAFAFSPSRPRSFSAAASRCTKASDTSRLYNNAGQKKQQESLAPLALKEEEEEGGLAKWQARALLLCIAALYGTNFSAVKILGEQLEPSFAATLRFALSSLVFSPFVWKVFAKQRGDIVLGGFETGVYNAVGYFAQAYALRDGTSASAASFICSLSVIVVPLLDLTRAKSSSSTDFPITLPQRLRPFAPAVIAATGVACLELVGSSSEASFHVGSAAYLQPLMFGFSLFRVEKLLRKCSQKEDFLAFTGGAQIAVLSGAILWLVATTMIQDPGANTSSLLSSQLGVVLASPLEVGFAILWTGFITTAGCTFLENVAMKKLSAAESAILFSTEPLWSTMWGLILLGESVGLNTAAGATLILSSCYLSQSDAIQREKALSAST